MLRRINQTVQLNKRAPDGLVRAARRVRSGLYVVCLVEIMRVAQSSESRVIVSTRTGSQTRFAGVSAELFCQLKRHNVTR